MTYTDFTLESVLATFGLTSGVAPLFPGRAAVEPPGWLTTVLGKLGPHSRRNEKARSEFIVAPLLAAARDVAGGRVAIFSGQRLDVDAGAGLTGECDFVLSATESYVLQAPLLTVVEAKRGDIELGFGQVAAQTLALARFNEKAGHPVPAVYGCITNADTWQFLRLTGKEVVFDEELLPLTQPGRILAALVACTTAPAVTASPAF